MYTIILCISSFPESQISVLLTLRPAIFELSTIGENCTNGPQITLDHTRPNVPHICVNSIHESHISLRFPYDQSFSRYRPFLRQVHRMNPKWHGQMYPICNTSFHDSHLFHSTSRHFPVTSHFRANVPDSQISQFSSYRSFYDKCIECLQNDLEPYKVKFSIYTYLHPRVPNFTPFHFMTCSFWVTCHFEISALNDPKIVLNTSRSRVHMCYWYLWAPNFSPFCSTTSLFWRYRTLTTTLNRPKKNKRKRIQNLKFRKHFNNCGRYPPQKYTWIFGNKCGVYFQRRCGLKVLLPCCPILTKTNKTWQKSKIWNFTILSATGKDVDHS